MRLDRFLSNLPRFSRADARLLLAAGRLRVDGATVRNGRHEIREFSRIELDDELLQAGKPARYFILNKPAGVVSATEHAEHRTVLDLLDEPDKHELHIGGRLDLNTTGLLLITNDGLWSRRLTEPRSRLGKVYRVSTEQPISAEYIEVFARGLYFAYENLTTLPAELQILDAHTALLTLHEGRYHQVRRMFAAVGNHVVALHRERVGGLSLGDLPEGEWRSLDASAREALFAVE